MGVRETPNPPQLRLFEQYCSLWASVGLLPRYLVHVHYHVLLAIGMLEHVGTCHHTFQDGAWGKGRDTSVPTPFYRSPVRIYNPYTSEIALVWTIC